MEQAVNLFNKGLQMDTHPMVLSNDTLTDALNATFVTMNGNEVILQNDMGNRKVDSAFLPAGYEPVGIKEYGGVIYVAAYNPLTSRGLIGSFPSPQRKINIDNSLSYLDFSKFIELLNGEYNIKVNSITIPISLDTEGNNIILHTGDKFSIYSEEINTLLPYILPILDTINNTKKNNLFTFQIGIFNSQNEFINISDKLMLWDNNYYINNLNNVLEEDEDEDLIKKRNSLAINTYSYKMSSSLYLKAILNTVDTVSCSIDGEKTGSNISTLYIAITYTYNCIDTIDGELFKILFKTSNGINLLDPIEQTEQTFNPEYLPETNQYKVTLNYILKNVNTPSTKLDYTIKFPLLNNFTLFGTNNNLIFLKDLEVQGTLNPSLFGSDTVLLESYRYYFNTTTNETTLDVKILSYPKKNSSYKIFPIICDLLKNELYKLPELESEERAPGSGSYTIVFNHAEITKINDSTIIGVDERELYYIKLVKEQDNNQVGILSPIEKSLNLDLDINNEVNNYYATHGLYITTELFNRNYIGEVYSNNVLTEDGGYNYDENSDYYIENFLNIKYLILNPILDCSFDTKESKINSRTTGNLLYELGDIRTEGIYHVIDEYDIITTINPIITIYDKELYPKEIDNLLSISNTTYDISSGEFSTRKINDIELIKDSNNKYLYSTDLILENDNYIPDSDTIDDSNVITISEEYSNLKFISHVKINNYVAGTLLDNKEIYCNNVITSLAYFIKKRYYTETNYVKFNSPFYCLDLWEWSPGMVQVDNWNYNMADINDDRRKSVGGNADDDIKIAEMSNDIIRSSTENFLSLDFSKDNHVYGFYPAYNDVENNHKNIGDNGKGLVTKIWMRISKDKFTPIYISTEKSEFGEGGSYLDKNETFLCVLTGIPHYYTYDSGGDVIYRKLINYNNCLKTKEFELSSEITLNLQTNVTKQNTDFFKFKTIDLELNEIITNNNTILLKQQVSFEEHNKYKSNEDFQETVENLVDFKLNCILKHYSEHDFHILTENMETGEGQYPFWMWEGGSEVIEYKDSEGKDFDPNYVYYVKPVTDGSSYSSDHNYYFKNGFIKSYKVENKFYDPNLGVYFPEFKTSDELYHASDGRVHPEIVSLAVPDTKTRTDILISEENLGHVSSSYTMFNGRPINIPFYSTNRIHNPTPNPWPCTCEISNWINGDAENYSRFFLNTANIFSYELIILYHLFTEPLPLYINGTIVTRNNQLSDGWKDADNCYNISS